MAAIDWLDVEKGHYMGSGQDYMGGRHQAERIRFLFGELGGKSGWKGRSNGAEDA